MNSKIDFSNMTSADRINFYTQHVKQLRDYALTRMGHPYTGPVKGQLTDDEWLKTDSSKKKLIDNTIFGISPDSIADTYINNVGSPYSDAKIIQRDVKIVERDIIHILAKYFGADLEQS